MIRKILLAILIALVVYWGYNLTNKEEVEEPFKDAPTEQEQRALEQAQPLPDAILESQMESLSPETAEND